MLKLSDVRKKLPFRISNPLGMFTIGDMATGRWGMTFDFDVFLPSKGKNLQRPLVWTLLQNNSGKTVSSYHLNDEL